MFSFRHVTTLLLVGMLWLAGGLPLAAQPGVVPVGSAGSYTTQKPQHRWAPSTAEGYDQVTNPDAWGIYIPRREQTPSLSQAFRASGKATPTHEPWSSTAWEFTVANLTPAGVTSVAHVPYSHVMSLPPWTMQFAKDGVRLAYSATPSLTPYRNAAGNLAPNADNPAIVAYSHDYPRNERGESDLNVFFEGLDAEETLLDDYGDFHGKILLSQRGTGENNESVRVTTGQAFPFIYFEKQGLGEVVFTVAPGTRLWYDENGTVAFSREDRRAHYAIFAPPGATWSYQFDNTALRYISPAGLRLTLPASQSFFSVAALPDEVEGIIRITKPLNSPAGTIPAGTALKDISRYVIGSPAAMPVAPLFQDFFENDAAGVANLAGLVRNIRRHAFVWPRDTRYDFSYDEGRAEVAQTWRVVGESRVSGAEFSDVPLMLLFRHQYRSVGAIDSQYSYRGPRGTMRLIAANQFSNRLHQPGLLPNIPTQLSSFEQERLRQMLAADVAEILSPGADFGRGMDTYGNGKLINRIAQLVPIAAQLGDTALQQRLLNVLKGQLEDWLDARDWQGDTDTNGGDASQRRKYFYYNADWNSLTGFPASFGSDVELNDHHFHYGYLIGGAATIARYDRAWAQRWAPMVNLLIQNCANWDRSDQRFQYLRFFDVYNGYSLANGHLNMDAGGNQESSSESVHFAASVAMWGAETGQTAIRDVGLALYAAEKEAIHQYWFDAEGQVFPKQIEFYNTDKGVWERRDFDRSSVGIVWHSKADYATWFGAVPQFIHGIQFLPVTPASLHLGQMTYNGNNALAKVFQRLDGNNRIWLDHVPAPDYFKQRTLFWSDLFWEMQAMFDAPAAVAAFEANPGYVREWDGAAPPLPQLEVRGESGETTSHTFHWLYNLAALGSPNPDVSANWPHFMVFDGNNGRNRVAYNPTTTARTVTFSDGAVMQVPARTLVVNGVPDGSGSDGSDGGDGGDGGDGSDGSDGSEPDTTPPTRPGTPQLTAATTTSLAISWQASSDDRGVVDYQVYVDGSLAATTAATQATLSGLQPGQSYNLHVVARDAAGNRSAASATATLRTESQDTGCSAEFCVEEVATDRAKFIMRNGFGGIVLIHVNDVDRGGWFLSEDGADYSFTTTPDAVPLKAGDRIRYKFVIFSNPQAESDWFTTTFRGDGGDGSDGGDGGDGSDGGDGGDGSDGGDGGPDCTRTTLPAKIEAEAYCNESGIQTETTSDVGGGQNIGWLDAGDWFTYAVRVPGAGKTRLTLRVAGQSNGRLQIEKAGGEAVYAVVDIPATGGWQTWRDVTVDLELPTGDLDLGFVVQQAGFNLNWLHFKAAPLPPIQVEAESYEAMSGVQVEATGDNGGGENVGYIDRSDWLAYPAVAIPRAGRYRIEFRVASQPGGGVLQFERAGGEVVYQRTDIPATGGWQRWQTLEAIIELPAGPLSFGIYAAEGGWNLNWFRLTALD